MQKVATVIEKKVSGILRRKFNVASWGTGDAAAACTKKDLDILVNNASLVEETLPVADSDLDD